MRRLIWLPVAGFLLVAGAAIAAAASAPSATPTQLANEDAASPAPTAVATPATANDQNTHGSRPDWAHGRNFPGAQADLLDQVLADLVKAGTITQAQSDAITNGLEQAITDQQAQAEQQRQQLQQQWTQIQGFLQDGAITQAEVDQLPANSPFRQVFDSIAKNGQVTLDQLRQLRLGPGGLGGPGMPGPGGHGHGHGWGPGMAPGHAHPGDDQNDDTQASPGTAGTSS